MAALENHEEVARGNRRGVVDAEYERMRLAHIAGLKAQPHPMKGNKCAVIVPHPVEWGVVVEYRDFGPGLPQIRLADPREYIQVKPLSDCRDAVTEEVHSSHSRRRVSIGPGNSAALDGCEIRGRRRKGDPCPHAS